MVKTQNKNKKVLAFTANDMKSFIGVTHFKIFDNEILNLMPELDDETNEPSFFFYNYFLFLTNNFLGSPLTCSEERHFMGYRKGKIINIELLFILFLLLFMNYIF